MAAEAPEQGNDSSNAQTAQLIPEFPAKPPSVPPPERPILRYKEPIPGLSGKEKADDIPTPFRGLRPLVGESGKQAAQRIFDEKYGKDKWSLKDPKTRRDFNKLQKYFDRGFRDPQALPGPENRMPGEEFGV